MSTHSEHQMQITSLFVKWGNWTEKQYNAKFRQEVERKILKHHLEHPEGLTDEELLNLFGNPDTNLVRPRRCDLSKEKRKKNGELKRPSFLSDSGEKRKNKHNSLCIVWKINPGNLEAYMGERKHCEICHSLLFQNKCPVHDR